MWSIKDYALLFNQARKPRQTKSQGGTIVPDRPLVELVFDCLAAPRMGRAGIGDDVA
jgi:hypothetical protein